MKYQIIQGKLTAEIKQNIFDQFSQDALQKVGFDGLTEEPIAFCAKINSVIVGACGMQLFWGQLHIKYLMVEKSWRNQGIGGELLKQALNYGAERKCNFAFVETLSFQAPDFYQKHGFKIELRRDGYAKNQSFYYLKRDL